MTVFMVNHMKEMAGNGNETLNTQLSHAQQGLQHAQTERSILAEQARELNIALQRHGLEVGKEIEQPSRAKSTDDDLERTM